MDDVTTVVFMQEELAGPSRKRHNVVLRELLTVDKLISKIAARCNDKANEQLSTSWQRQVYL